MSDAWSRLEVEATVADYLHMLTLELAGQTYNKSTYRRALLRKLNSRTEAAIELKHQNISAIMIELGCPYISGYKPRRNYQGLLFEIVSDQLKAAAPFDRAALAAVELPAATPIIEDFSNINVDPPAMAVIASDSAKGAYTPQPKRGITRDYLAREAHNQALGKAGEDFILQYERWRLIRSGKESLADKVEHVSQTQGDGLGYDILSYETSGKERLIEVKTTSFGKETPFFITQNELAFSKAQAEIFQLYRVFEFRKEPKMFALSGAVNAHCLLDPISYRARFS